MADVFTNAGIEAARAAQDDIVLEAAAHRVALTVRAVAAPHNDTGNYQRSISVGRHRYGRGVTDWVVTTSDPNAMQIEYGHRLYIDRDHDGTAEPTGRYVPGLRIFNRAFDILKATGG